MNITINKESSIPYYIQIKEQIKNKIVCGEIKKGFPLPPERRLAQMLGVNRTTILNAYRELKNENLIISKTGSGTIIAGIKSDSAIVQQPTSAIIWRNQFNKIHSGDDPAHINNMLKVIYRDDAISFAVGVPDPALYPTDFVKNSFNEIVDNNKSAFYYAPAEGLQSFRKVIAGFHTERGVLTQPQNILPVSGAQQGLDLIAKLFIEPGDIIITQDPTYIGAKQIFKNHGARIFSIPHSFDESNLLGLENILQNCKPKFIYVNPTFQNPTGITIDKSDRLRLLELSYKYQIPVIEDDPYSEINFTDKRILPIKSYDDYEQVIFVGTFSKSVFPGLRLGWINGTESLIKKLSSLKQTADLSSSITSQLIFQQFLKSGEYDKHIEIVKSHYKKKLAVMENALQKYSDNNIKWIKPDGGFYLWCVLPENIDTLSMLSTATEAGVAYVPGEPFSPTGSFRNQLRLNFSFPEVSVIDEGVKRLCEVVARKIETSGKARLIDKEDRLPII